MRNIVRKFLKKKNSSEIKENKEGFFLVDNEYTIYSHNKGCIERAYKHIFSRHIYDFNATTDSPTIIDAGANIGLGVLYWKRKYPNCKIIAFEPSIEVYKSLVKNVERNHLKNVTCINKALADKETKLLFSTNEIISGSLVLEKNLQNTYEVETIMLAPYLQEKIDLLKIDIEGAERLIYNDIKENLSNINNVFLEYHSFTTETQYLGQYLSLFESNKFRYYIENDIQQSHQFISIKESLKQDLQLNIWIKRENE